MSSAERLREFVNERLTAAAEEIFGVFKQTIIKYEEEIDRQRRLLDIVWKPELKLQRIELPQQHVFTEELLSDQDLCVQERNSCLDQEPPQIKEEQKELCISREGRQLVLKEETETFMLTPTDEESGHSDDQTLNLNPDQFLIAADRESMVNVLVTLASDPKSDYQFPTHNSQFTKSQDQKGGEHENPGLIRSRPPEEESQHHESRSHSINVCSSAVSDILCNTYTSQESLKCGACEKGFESKSRLQKHLRIHTGERPYICKICGKTFRFRSNLTVHIRVHTGEKPYHCNTCGKRFTDSSTMKRHLTVHTDEKPYSCKVCGKMYRQSSTLKDHMRIHTEGSCSFARHEENNPSKCIIWKGHQDLI